MARKPKAAAKAAPAAKAAGAPQTIVPPPEVITVRSRRVACDGVGGALGHPRVWLEMGEADFVECGYPRVPPLHGEGGRAATGWGCPTPPITEIAIAPDIPTR
jgi:uncharacterized Zn-finger protein